MKYLRKFNEDHLLSSFGDEPNHLLMKINNITRDDLEIGANYRYTIRVGKNRNFIARAELIDVNKISDKFFFKIIRILTPNTANGITVGDIITSKGTDLSKNFSLK